MKSVTLLSCIFTLAVTMSSLAAATPAPTDSSLLGSGESSDGSTRFMLLTSEAALLGSSQKDVGTPQAAPLPAKEKNSAILNRIISLRVQVQPLPPLAAASAPEVTLLSFDARMPAHAHGMLVKPSSPRQLATNLWQIDGIKLHMPGHWVVSLTTETQGKKELVEINVNVSAFPSRAEQNKAS